MALVSRRNGPGFSRLIPAATLVAATLLALTPLPLAGHAAPMPALPLAAIFFWSLHRQEWLPPWLLFLCGVAYDALLGLPLGAHPFLFLLLRLATLRLAARIRRSVWFFWMAFVTLTLGYWLAYWLLLGYLLAAPLPLRDALRHWAVTAAVYPLLHWLFTRLPVQAPQAR